LLSILVFQTIVKAQSIQFMQEQLGACDSVSTIDVSAYLFPDTIKWDSLSWRINGMLSAQKSQIIKANLGDQLIVRFFYNNPVITVIDTLVVVSTESISFKSFVTNNTRYNLNTSTVWLSDSNLFKVNQWSLSQGSLISSSYGKAYVQANGNVNIACTYNSGCIEHIALYIPLETQPELILEQIVLADPIGAMGSLTGNLSDGSIINTLNGSTIDASTFNIPLAGGMQTLVVTSGSFSWTKQFFVESMPDPNFEIEQTQVARWCDGADAEIEIVISRGLIDSLFHTVMHTINNDSAYIPSSFGGQTFTVYSGNSVFEIHRIIEKEGDWSIYVGVSEIESPICSESADGSAILQYPAEVVYLETDNQATPLQDSLLNLSAGQHSLFLADARGCSTSQVFIVPQSQDACIQTSDIFSPNGDGINDIWMPLVPQGTTLTFRVYTYRDIQMNAIASKEIYEGSTAWDGSNNLTGTGATAGYYLIISTIAYPAYMNIATSTLKHVVKLLR